MRVVGLRSVHGSMSNFFLVGLLVLPRLEFAIRFVGEVARLVRVAADPEDRP